MEYDGTHRYQLQKQRDVPIIDISKQVYDSSWDTFKNNDIKRRKLITSEFLRVLKLMLDYHQIDYKEQSLEEIDEDQRFIEGLQEQATSQEIGER